MFVWRSVEAAANILMQSVDSCFENEGAAQTVSACPG